jgi:hypothetical protein
MPRFDLIDAGAADLKSRCCDTGVVLLTPRTAVIPGRAAWREPGIWS